MDGRELKDGEVCVKMLAAPINPSDINRIEGSAPVSVWDYATAMNSQNCYGMFYVSFYFYFPMCRISP